MEDIVCKTKENKHYELASMACLVMKIQHNTIYTGQDAVIAQLKKMTRN